MFCQSYWWIGVIRFVRKRLCPMFPHCFFCEISTIWKDLPGSNRVQCSLNRSFWNPFQLYCWWQPEIRPENQLRLVVYLPLFAGFWLSSQVVSRISFINSMEDDFASSQCIHFHLVFVRLVFLLNRHCRRMFKNEGFEQLRRYMELRHLHRQPQAMLLIQIGLEWQVCFLGYRCFQKIAGVHGLSQNSE